MRGLGARKSGILEHLVEGELVVQLITGWTIEGKDADVRGQLLLQVCVSRAFHRSSARNDEVDALLLDDSLDGGLPFFGWFVGRGST